MLGKLHGEYAACIALNQNRLKLQNQATVNTRIYA